MSELREQAAAILKGLVSQEGCSGTALVTRDGLPALVEFDHPIDPQTLAAMGAAALAAAETALLELDPGGLDRMVAEGASSRCLFLGVDDRHLLLVIARGAGIDAAASEARDRLRELLAG